MFSLGNGIALMHWKGEESPEPSTDGKADGKRVAKAPHRTPATLTLAAAVEKFAPKSNQAPRKAAFKVSAPLEIVGQRNAAVIDWSGDCGLFDIISPDDLVLILSHATHQARFLVANLVCKSFRVLRGEESLFAMVRLLDGSRGDGMCVTHEKERVWKRLGTEPPIEPEICDAANWVNRLASRANIITALDLSGNAKAPLTALKVEAARAVLAPNCGRHTRMPQLTTLSCYTPHTRKYPQHTLANIGSRANPASSFSPRKTVSAGDPSHGN